MNVDKSKNDIVEALGISDERFEILGENFAKILSEAMLSEEERFDIIEITSKLSKLELSGEEAYLLGLQFGRILGIPEQNLDAN